MANIFEFLSKDGNITPEKARKSRQMQFRDKTAYVTLAMINLVTALSSIVDISVVPAEPAHQERNPESPEDPKQLKELRNISTMMSLVTFPIFLVANIGVYMLSQTDTFQANPNNVLTTDQINFLTLYVLFPLAAVYVATIIFFHLTFLSSREWCKYFKAAVNVLSIIATFASLLTMMTSVFPHGPSKIVLSIQTRDRVSFVEGLTWTQKWNSSSNEWDLKNGSFVSLDNITLKEFVSQYPQNAKSSENTTIFLKTNVSSLTEHESFIKIVKPYPPSTDNTSDVYCINCPNKESNYCKHLLYEVKEKNAHIVTCEKAVDGYWSPWKDGPCQTYFEVPKGNPCGEGWQMQTRTCQGRKFGGKYCSGRGSNHRQCTAQTCPGMSLGPAWWLNERYVTLLMFLCISEWKVETKCNATLDHSGKQLQALYSTEKVVIEIVWIKCYFKGNGGKKVIIYFLCFTST